MKYALITGGTRGIGLQTARLFSEKDYIVTALYSSDEEAAEQARTLLPSVKFVRADVSSEEAVKKVFEGLPALDILVNNAGISLYKQVQDTTPADWQRVMAVNAGGTFLCCKHAVKKFLERGGGSIINVASVWGETGGSCESAYSASKGAVIALTKALAKELAPSSIRVNCISPGAIDTEMNGHLSCEERRMLEEEVPLGRFGRAEEIAEAIYFLATQTYATGQDFAVNGGLHI